MRSKINMKRIMPVILFVVMTIICMSIWVFDMANIRSARAEDPKRTYTFKSVADFITYADEYNNENAHNQTDELRFSTTQGAAVLDLEGFTGLGTASRPFAGSIYIGSSDSNTFRLYDAPLFDYVTTDLTITIAGEGDRSPVLIRGGTTSTSALFANHVYQGDGAANWSITLSNQSDATHGGLIGEIGDGATVSVSFTNNSSINIVGSGNTGLIAGTLGAGATLNVTTAGSGSGLGVSTDKGNAGGLVGEMKTGAVLQLDSANSSRVTSVSTAASNGDNSGYAGGIVGFVNDAIVQLAAGVSDYTVSGSVSGANAAGGLFGYYYSNTYASNSVSLASYNITSGMAISSSGNTGGVFGVLRSERSSFSFNGNSDNSETLTVSLNGGSNRGGVAGQYRTNALTNTLSITKVRAIVTGANSVNCAGLIGQISEVPAYVSISDVSCSSGGSSTISAGLIGDAGSGGSFIDVSGTVTASGRLTGGLIGTLSEGVLRLAGTTNVSGITSANGLIVNQRGHSLVYALGTGAGDGWVLNRPASFKTDDIYKWGQVLRLDGTTLTESNLFTVNMTNHTVSIKTASTTVSSLLDFAKLALNIQLNTSGPAGSALIYTTGTSSSASLLASGSLSIKNTVTTIDLSGTGLTGLTRDDGVNAAFTGTFNGNNKTIVISIGEQFGNGKDVYVYNHKYTGLFAKTGNSTIKNLTIKGSVRVDAKGETGSTESPTYWNVGGVVAYAQGNLTLNTVSLPKPSSAGNYDGLTVTLNVLNSGAWVRAGGAIGTIAPAGSVTISAGSYGADLVDLTNVSGSSETIFGGVIGTVEGSRDSQLSQTITISSATLSSKYTKQYTNRAPHFGGVIGRIEHAYYSATGSRDVFLNTVTINYTASATPVDGVFGGILGDEWYATDVTISSLSIASTTLTATTNSADMGGLVRIASGHWDIQSLSLGSNVTISAPSGSTFGFVANKAYYNGDDDQRRTVLYLDVDNTSTNYNIASLSFTNGTSFDVFDELVADSRFDGADIVSNGQAIISVSTTDGSPIIFTGSDCNTYQNQTTYGKNNQSVNANTRYYYNLKSIRTANATPAYNLLLWSVKAYAHSSIKDFFVCTTAFSGNLDMTGLSYYPVNLSGETVSFSSATLTLDNNGIEASENYSFGSSDGTVRSTRTDSTQHYLMHTALFINVSSTVNIAGLTINGNVPKLSNSYCGFLVAGTIGGTTGAMISAGNEGDIVFNGAFISDSSNGGSPFATSVYSPLLINTVSENATISIDGIRQSGYNGSNGIGMLSSTKYAGSSVIGNVGGESARSIRLSFTRVALDSRTAAISEPANSSLNSVYGTNRSIFSLATLLNSFAYFSESSGAYNFSLEEDWENSTSPLHLVTYGKEIRADGEHGDQTKYYRSNTNYVDPTTGANITAAYDFSTGFLPYINNNTVNNHHELSINIFVTVTVEGWGTYANPYIIDVGEKLDYIAKIIAGTALNISQTSNLTLPNSFTNFDATNGGTYQFNGTYFKSSGDLNTVREYLAGAYYKITGNINLPASFPGLGAVDDFGESYACQYAFRGVITADAQMQITNFSASPLIYSANGCVVKNITIVVNSTITLSQPSLTPDNTVFKYRNGMQTYGALIGQVMGGDNIIDAVSLNYNGATIVWSDSTNTRLVPVGGYIGTLLSGGVIFRNYSMQNNIALSVVASGKVSGTGAETWLYVNPIIGRIIAGYAFYEGDEYTPLEEDCTVKNGIKNYSIPDLDLGGVQLSVTRSGSTTNVTAPNGQAMFVLASIINCGAASASYDASAEQAYATVGYPSYALGYKVGSVSATANAYRAHTTARGLSDYSTVGSSSGNEYTYASEDTYSSNATKVPYIIRAYTNKTGNVYLARTIGSASVGTLTISGDCTLPESFRGIGSMYDDNSSVRLTFTTLAGGNHTITFNTKYYEYNVNRNVAYKFAHSDGYGDYHNYHNEMAIRSIGLFNQVYDGNITINDLILAGSIDYDLLNSTNGDHIAYDFGATNTSGKTAGVDKTVVTTQDGVGRFDGVAVNVGGLCGYVFNKRTLTVNNVDFSGNFTVRGAKWAGGLVGAGYDATIYINNCDTLNDSSTLSVLAGHQAGGYIGRYRNVAININNSQSAKSSLNIGTISVFGNISSNPNLVSDAPADSGANDSNNNGAYSVGGLIGYMRPEKNISVNRVTLNGGQIKLENVANDNSIGFAGGILGSVFAMTASTFDTITINGVDIIGEASGGLIGGASLGSITLAVNNFTLDGQNTATIDGKNKAGGLLGILKAGTMSLDKVIVKGYNIKQEYQINNTSGAGGLVGQINANTTNMYNVEVSDCIITSGYTSNNNNKGTGGLFGVATGSGNARGYNIFLNGLTIKNTQNLSYGAFVGNNVSSSQFKLVGVSYNNITDGSTIMTSKGLVTEQLLKHSSSYVVFSDYDNIAADKENANQSFSTAGSGANVNPASPYVTLNPALDLGGLTLTGDGVSQAANTAVLARDNPYYGLAINEVMYKILTTSGGKYQYAATATARDAATNADSTYLQIMSKYKASFDRFSSLAGDGYSGADFVVLALEDTNYATSHEFINTYIRLLTNTTYDYKTANASIYSVNVYNVKYTSGSGFAINNGAVSLKFNNTSGFHINSVDFDSGRAQFSLIDIKYFNPSDTSKVAYHLYIPVVVKKVIVYDFNVSAANGTNYFPADYIGANRERFGEALMENTGMPITLYLEYIYSKENDSSFRNKEEWINALNSGETLAGYYNKYLSFALVNNAMLDLANDTLLVLIDPNSGGRAYYAFYNVAVSNGVLNLQSFTTSLDGNGTNFTPANLDEVFGITVSASNTGTLVQCTGNEVALFVGKDQNGYRLATESDSARTKYAVTDIDGFTEKYFLSIITNAQSSNQPIYHYAVTTPSDLSGSLPMARLKKSATGGSLDPTVVRLILGKIFTQSDISLESSSVGNALVMSASNNILNAEMSVSLGLNEELGDFEDDVKGYLESISVYHSFVVYLTRSENGASERVIIGDPTGSGSYSINSGESLDYNNEAIRVTPYYAEFVTGDLSAQLKQSQTTISSSVSLEYLAADIPVQFPGRKPSKEREVSDGVTVSAASNIAFSMSSTSSSKNSVSETDEDHIYYTINDSEGAELYLGVVGDREGDHNPLGINPLSLGEGVSSYELNLAGVFDITGIYSDVGDWDSVSVSISLSQKQSDGTYSEPLEISRYIRSINDVSLTAGRTNYSYTIARDVNSVSPQIYIDMKLIVITGPDFESANLMYSNYRVTVSVALLDDGNEVIDSSANNYVVYTHSKVVLDFITDN